APAPPRPGRTIWSWSIWRGRPLGVMRIPWGVRRLTFPPAPETSPSAARRRLTAASRRRACSSTMLDHRPGPAASPEPEGGYGEDRGVGDEEGPPKPVGAPAQPPREEDGHRHPEDP